MRSHFPESQAVWKPYIRSSQLPAGAAWYSILRQGLVLPMMNGEICLVFKSSKYGNVINVAN